jgi:hypothetical protein
MERRIIAGTGYLKQVAGTRARNYPPVNAYKNYTRLLAEPLYVPYQKAGKGTGTLTHPITHKLKEERV